MHSVHSFGVATVRKVRSGISFDRQLLEALDKHAVALKELGVDRSELVNAILTEYLDGNDSAEAVWGVISRRRIKERS